MLTTKIDNNRMRPVPLGGLTGRSVYSRSGMTDRSDRSTWNPSPTMDFVDLDL